MDYEGILLLLLCYSYVLIASSEKAHMKIVKDVVNYGSPGLEYNQRPSVHDSGDNEIFIKRRPANISGPEHLFEWYEKCFEWTSEKYNYILCPFQNVTQHELQTTWMPYRGVLGIYSGWNITNNKFHSMQFDDGDSCGNNVNRQVEVIFHCSQTNTQIVNVTEPERCKYKFDVGTQFVCHSHSMLVYPRLSSDIQREWNDIETQRYHEELTPIGYNKLLSELWERIGYQLSSTKRWDLMIKPGQQNKHNVKKLTQHDADLCTKEKQRLQSLVQQLQKRIDELQFSHKNKTTVK